MTRGQYGLLLLYCKRLALSVTHRFAPAHRRVKKLVLMHWRQLLNQWVAQLSGFFTMSPREIGRIGGGCNKPTRRVDVATIQSLVLKAT